MKTPCLEKKKKSSGNILAVVSLFCLASICASITATQSIASKFGYHEALNGRLAAKLYYPWMWIPWSSKYSDEYIEPFQEAGNLALTTFAFIFLSGAGITMRLQRKKAHIIENLHGSATFAEEAEVEKMGLLSGEGVYCGAYKSSNGEVRYLMHNGPEHVFAFAPTRSGKGVGLVIPTLLSWRHSAIVLDIKGENWALTAGWRKHYANNLCLKFDPAAPEGSARFNPLREVRLGTMYEVADVQNLVTIIVDPDGKGLNDHWAKTGHALLVGAVLHHMYSEQSRGSNGTLQGVAELLSDPSKPIEELFNEMLNTKHKGSSPHPVIAACARDMLNKAENERSGVLSTAMSFLSLYRDPIVAKNTEDSDFRIHDLMNNDKPVSLYLIVRPSDKDRLKPLFRMIINQILRSLTSEMKFKDGRSVRHYKHRLLLMLDEFPSLGRLDIFQESLAFIAGYGIKAYLISQDKDQVNNSYGKDESITSNCHIRLAYAPNKSSTAGELSDMLGTTTIINPNISVSGKKGIFEAKSYTTSESEVGRKLMTADETMRLPGAIKDKNGDIVEAGDMLIFVAGFNPVYGKQILYFIDPVFSERAKVPPPEKSDRCIKTKIRKFKLA